MARSRVQQAGLSLRYLGQTSIPGCPLALDGREGGLEEGGEGRPSEGLPQQQRLLLLLPMWGLLAAGGSMQREPPVQGLWPWAGVGVHPVQWPDGWHRR